MKVQILCLWRQRMVACVFGACLASACSADGTEKADTFVPLVQAMADRLATADQVALSKWDSGKAVYDAVREKQVISHAAEMASDYGLTPDDASAIFTDQIEANKVVQYGLLNNWRRQGNQAPLTSRQSLTSIIRPELDKIQLRIMSDLRDVAVLRHAADCQVLVAMAAGQVAGSTMDGLHLAALDRAVARVCIKP